MSIQHITSSLQTSPSVENNTGEETSAHLATNDPKRLTTNEELRENLRKTNIRYIFDQINRSMQVSTQEMIRQVRERQKEEE